MERGVKTAGSVTRIKSSKDADLVTSRSILHRVKVTQRLNVLYSIS